MYRALPRIALYALIIPTLACKGGTDTSPPPSDAGHSHSHSHSQGEVFYFRQLRGDHPAVQFARAQGAPVDQLRGEAP